MATIDEPNRRFFTAANDAGDDIKLQIREPNRKEIELADMQYSATFTRALLAGLPPRSKLLRLLRERELWTPDDETAMEESRLEVIRLEGEITDAQKAEDGEDKDRRLRKLNKQHAAALDAFNGKRADIESMLEHSADAKGFEAQRTFLLACVVEFADGEREDERLYRSVEAYLNDTDVTLGQRVLYEFVTFNNGQPSNWAALTALNAEDDEAEETEEDADDAASETLTLQDDTADEPTDEELEALTAPAPERVLGVPNSGARK
jgi:hypothetical protein